MRLGSAPYFKVNLTVTAGLEPVNMNANKKNPQRGPPQKRRMGSRNWASTWPSCADASPYRIGGDRNLPIQRLEIHQGWTVNEIPSRRPPPSLAVAWRARRAVALGIAGVAPATSYSH
jgi:hypothetical protein